MLSRCLYFVLLLLLSARWVVIAQAAPQILRFEPMSGLAGTKVELTGQELGGALLVYFNGVPAQFSYDNVGGILTTIVPAGAVTGPILVMTAGGVVATSENFIISEAAPTILSFTRTGRVGDSVIL